jgi:hypothetical protein
MEINGLSQIYEMCFLLYLIISIYIIRLYLDKKFRKKEYKCGYYAIFPSYQNLTYIFIKKNGKYIFKVYGNILIGYRYLESKIPNFEVQMELLKIKLKEKFKLFLNKKTDKLCIIR